MIVNDYGDPAVESAIWKYAINFNADQQIEMPAGAKILKAAEQGGGMFVWAFGNPSADKELKHICVFATGEPILQQSTMRYIDTIMLMGGKLVFHVFEKL